MFDYLMPSQDAVVEGLESYEKIYALEQAEYLPLRTLPGHDGDSAITRWVPTQEQRKAIADGADIMLEVLHFRGPLAPVSMAVMKPENDLELWNEWFCSQTRGTYFAELAEKRAKKRPESQ